MESALDSNDRELLAILYTLSPLNCLFRVKRSNSTSTARMRLLFLRKAVLYSGSNNRPFSPSISCLLKLSGSLGPLMNMPIPWARLLILTIGTFQNSFPNTFLFFLVLSRLLGLHPSDSEVRQVLVPRLWSWWRFQCRLGRWEQLDSAWGLSYPKVAVSGFWLAVFSCGGHKGFCSSGYRIAWLFFLIFAPAREGHNTMFFP